MSTKVKINDNSELRLKIDELFEKISQENSAKWSLLVAKHTFGIAGIDYNSIGAVVNGFAVNELWQAGRASMNVVRRAGFEIHKMARECDSEIKKTVLRAAGHAVASGHMKEHAMVVLDYAVKATELIHSSNIDAITAEREWQLQELKKFLQL